ncbi:MLP-like protein 328 [Camellia lanceoleosa]|uniref:MLP-like protein 328 n=1 Tax=Camellia lanceoleosa TaxID=1840588 RepID=A0ACC0IJQ2_9ERIC|nr:MLP-like protein 328 [Camellia lanceoleosa]
MDLGGKMEGEVEIKCDADELFQICSEGKVGTFKEKVTIDEENKTVHWTAVEGHCLDLYKSYNIIYQIIHKGETNVLKITIKYEKQNEDVPPPQKYMDFIRSRC